MESLQEILTGYRVPWISTFVMSVVNWLSELSTDANHLHTCLVFLASLHEVFLVCSLFSTGVYWKPILVCRYGIMQ